MKIKNIFLIFAIISVLLIAGCSSNSQETCSQKDTTYQKFSYDDGSDTCVGRDIPKDEPDNGVIEDGENYCNAPNDVPKVHPTLGCEGKLGDYLEKSCNEKTKTCDFYQNEKVVTSTKVLDFKNSDLTIQGEFKLPTPFILNSADKNKVSVSLSLFKTLTSSILIKDLVVKDFAIENYAQTRYGSYTFNKPLNKIGSKLSIIEIPLADTTQYKLNENLKLKLVISYIKDTYDNEGNVVKSENKIETLVNSLGTWTIINPNFKK